MASGKGKSLSSGKQPAKVNKSKGGIKASVAKGTGKN